ncbi:MAG: hypothetical protein LQ347_003883 [Umbilicaria vellea]|nr:MAG: hypothetical protein LQ347_003883 [Umbilicaria vellea]
MEKSDSVRTFHLVIIRQLTKADSTLLVQRSQDISREELFQQFGRLEHANTSLEQAVAAAQEREKTLRTEHTELTAKKGELTAANAELTQALDASKAEVVQLRDQLSGLQAQIAKMEKTIKVQSEQISKKPEVNNTPHRHNPAAPPFGHQEMLPTQPDPRALIYAQPPPPYNPKRIQPTGASAPSTLLAQQSSIIRGSATSSPDHYPPPALSRQQSFAGQPLIPHGKAQASKLDDEMDPDMNALVLHDSSDADVDFPTELDQLFKLSETWARNFANVPDSARDRSMPESIVGIFCRYSAPHVAFGLLSSGSTRFFLVAKVINKWMTNEALKLPLVKGYSAATDNEIAQAKKRASERDASIQVQRACMALIAGVMKDIQAAPDYQSWLQRAIDGRAKTLWKTVSPLLAPGADAAWDELVYLMTEAHRVGFKILSMPIRVSFDYPEVGPHTYFEPSSMLNRDTTLKGDPKSWKQQHLRVRLGITPVVVTTDTLGDTINLKTVHLANVLLMQ